MTSSLRLERVWVRSEFGRSTDERVLWRRPHHWDLREFGSDWSSADRQDEILREFGSERDFVEGEERKRELEIETVATSSRLWTSMLVGMDWHAILKKSIASFLQTRWVRWYFHSPLCKRNFFLLWVNSFELTQQWIRNRESLEFRVWIWSLMRLKEKEKEKELRLTKKKKN